jgi:two-component system LytT family sensor kinase
VKVLPFHLIGWILLIFLNIAFIKNYHITFDAPYHLITWAIFIGIFYVNYLLLMPLFFFKRRFLFYIIVSLVLLFGLQFLKQSIDHKHFEKIFRTEVMDDPMMKEHFDPGKMQPPPDFKMSPRERRPPGKMPRPLFSLYGLVLFYMASISLRFIQKWQEDEKRNREIEKEKITSELTFLRQQINPHFLFNALNSIYAMTINTSETASNTILKLSSILRYMLYETENRLVNLKDEINIINDYIDLQKIRMPQNVMVNFHVSGDTGNKQIAPLLLIPIIENAFKYGTDNVNDAFIYITISILNNELELQVENRIVQREQNSGTDSGIGIKNIRRRLELLYPDNYYFETDQTNGIFTVTLKLKMKE